jgi:hypothetical protein
MLVRIRNKGTVQRIKIPSDKLEVIHKILNSNVSEIVKENIIKRLSEGNCCVCRTVATHKVIYDASDERGAAQRIEKYCDLCIKKVYEREPTVF